MANLVDNSKVLIQVCQERCFRVCVHPAILFPYTQ
jgi:hypothetical protein